MKSKDGQEDIFKGNGAKAEIGKPAEVPPQPMPAALKKAQNFMPDILEIAFEPSSCSETTLCKGFGGQSAFNVDFKLDKEPYDNHLIKIGLRRGRLQLNLEPLKAGKLLPKTIIAPTTLVVEEIEDSHGAKISIKKLHLSEGGKKRQTIKKTFINISRGGTPERPWWLFEIPGDQLLEGTAENIFCKIIPLEDICCKFEYKWAVETGDWSYDLTIDSKLCKLSRYFAKLKMREVALRKIVIRNYHAEQLKYVLSNGRWKCPANK